MEQLVLAFQIVVGCAFIIRLAYLIHSRRPSGYARCVADRLIYETGVVEAGSSIRSLHLKFYFSPDKIRIHACGEGAFFGTLSGATFYLFSPVLAVVLYPALSVGIASYEITLPNPLPSWGLPLGLPVQHEPLIPPEGVIDALVYSVGAPTAPVA